jgi:hypothetical protein
LGMLYYEKIRNPAQAALAWNQLKVGYPDSPYLTLGLSSQINSSRNRAEQEGKKKKKRR